MKTKNKENSFSYAMIAIVAIVAIVSLVTLLSAPKSETTYSADSEDVLTNIQGLASKPSQFNLAPERDDPQRDDPDDPEFYVVGEVEERQGKTVQIGGHEYRVFLSRLFESEDIAGVVGVMCGEFRVGHRLFREIPVNHFNLCEGEIYILNDNSIFHYLGTLVNGVFFGMTLGLEPLPEFEFWDTLANTESRNYELDANGEVNIEARIIEERNDGLEEPEMSVRFIINDVRTQTVGEREFIYLQRGNFIYILNLISGADNNFDDGRFREQPLVEFAFGNNPPPIAVNIRN